MGTAAPHWCWEIEKAETRKSPSEVLRKGRAAAASGKLREIALSKEDIPSPVFSSVAHALWSWHWPGPCQEGEARG